MANLKELVEAVKAKILNADVTTSLYDINNVEVVFDVQAVEDIAEGVTAKPDGEFLFSDGFKITISGGKVEKIESIIEEAPAEVETTVETIEDTVSESDSQIVNEMPLENTEAEEEPKEEETAPEPDKDAIIKELLDKIEELNGTIKELTEAAAEKESEIEAITSDLEEIKNFYSSVSTVTNRAEEKASETPSSGFKFTARKR